MYLGFVDTDMVTEGFEHPSALPALSGGPKFLGKPMPLTVAGRTLADAVEQRRARAWAPRWVGPMLALRGVIQPLMDRQTGRHKGMIEAVRISDDAAQRGDELPGATIADRGLSAADRR